MSINVTGRQFEVTPQVRERVERSVRPILENPTLKTSSINVVFSREKNRFLTSLVVNCKYHVVKSEVEDFDLDKSFDAAVQKVENQLKSLQEKIRDHKADGISASESKAAAGTVDSE